MWLAIDTRDHQTRVMVGGNHSEGHDLPGLGNSGPEDAGAEMDAREVGGHEASRLGRMRGAATSAFRSLLAPAGLPGDASRQLETTLGGVVDEALSSGPGRLRRVKARMAGAPDELLTWASTYVLDHPLPVLDGDDVAELSARQTKYISAAVGGLQIALVAATAATFESTLVPALAVDAVVGQVAALVHGFADWTTTASFLVRRLRAEGLDVTSAELRRLTTAALVSRGKVIDPGMLPVSTEGRLVRRWAGSGLVDALPFGSSLGRASVKAAGRIEASDLRVLLAQLRSSAAG